MDEEIRERLLRRRAQLEAQVQRIRHDLQREGEPLSPDFEEQAVQREDDEVLDQLGMSAQAELQHIDTALARLRAGTYGICELCAEVIEPQRLAVVPYARRCRQCSEEPRPGRGSRAR